MIEYPDTFVGDGRIKVDPTFRLPHVMSTSVTRAQARGIIDRFESSDHSQHSATGSTLWVVLWYCQVRRVSYNLTAHPGLGYSVLKVARP